MDDFLPQIRITSEVRRKLELIADKSITANLSAHIRFAVEQYVDANWTPELQQLLDEDEPVTQLS